MGPDLSTVVAFFNLAPLRISPKRASLPFGIDRGGGGGDQGPVGEAEVVGVGQPWLSREEVVLEDVDVEDNGDS